MTAEKLLLINADCQLGIEAKEALSTMVVKLCMCNPSKYSVPSIFI